MKEFKFHINRQFGTEQFSTAVVIHSETNPTQQEIEESLDVLNDAIDIQFVKVTDREIEEKKYSASRLEERMKAYQQFNDVVEKFVPKEDQVEVTVGDTPTVPTEVSSDRIEK